MTNQNSTLAALFQKIEKYIQTTTNLWFLKLMSNATELIAKLISYVVFLFLFALFIMFSSIGLAIWIGDCMGKSYQGFLIIGGLYFLISMLIFKFRYQWLNESLNKILLKSILKSMNNENTNFVDDNQPTN